ncbi:MAG TPA: hypothetical protein VLF66_18330 [Thermoanaerobaculia bacterium]|nr:hypothetical protein [Thermoanaerobaculia bacterium]
MKPGSVRAVPSLVLLLALSLAGTLALPGAAAGQARSAPLAEAPASLAKAAAVGEPPARIASGVEPLARLVEAGRGAADQVEALAAWNRAGRRPVRSGIVRPVPLPRQVRFGGGIAAEAAGLHAGGAFARVGAGSTVWGASVEVAGSHRLRLHLDGVDLPPGTRMWVYGVDGEAVSFGPELAREGSLWTPSVYGPEIRLEVELPRADLAGAADRGFVVDRVAEIFRLGPDLAPVIEPSPLPKGVNASCLIDVTCVTPSTFSVVDLAERAIAHIEFVQGAFLGLCTGGLLNVAADAPPGTEPGFLTANHCLDTQAVASTLEAFWDYKTQSCDGVPPALGSLPRSNGSQLLASDPISDFTFLGMSFPANRVLLGWNAEHQVLPADTETHRISHPVPGNDILPQQYTRNRTLSEAEILRCGTDGDGRATDNLSRFIHSVFLEGGTFGGSSGAPLILDNGQVVGQLLGACGSAETVNDGCSMENDEIDGNFFTTFDFVAPFLGATPPGGALTTPELPGFEFEVTITPAGSTPIEGAAESDCIAETLCVSGALPGRPEVFVKIIGPRPNGFLWVQISRFTPSRVDVTVRQLSTGDENQYTLEAVGPASDDVSGLQDRTAFNP